MKSVCQSWLGAVVLSLNSSAALITTKAGTRCHSVAVGLTDGSLLEEFEIPHLDRAKELLQSLGGEVRYFYLTMGAYDAVATIEAPARSLRAPSANKTLGSSFGLVYLQSHDR